MLLGIRGDRLKEQTLVGALRWERRVPHYFFDTHDGDEIRDEEGLDCIDAAEARNLAIESLPEFARWAIRSGSDRQTFTVLVRDEAGRPVYTTTLTLNGQWLSRDEDEPSAPKCQ